MKNAGAYARRFSALLRQIGRHHHPAPLPQRDPVIHLVLAFLQWNATRRGAEAAHHRLMAVLVDSNDLRVSHHHEVMALLGERYPLADERAGRLHDALQEIFNREHGVTLAALADKGRKEMQTYFDTLPGITPYVAAAVQLYAFGGHALPVDDVLAERLRQEGVVDPQATVEQIAAFLERQVDAEQALPTHLLLQAWADAGRKEKKQERTAKSDKHRRDA